MSFNSGFSPLVGGGASAGSGGGTTVVSPTGHAVSKNNPNKPASLLCYYGYPISYRGLNVNQLVIDQIGAFDHWICGDQYQAPAHEAYASTVAICQGVRKLGTKVWGYVPIGVNTENLSLATIRQRIGEWSAVGVDGIFLDEFGFDYLVTRQRQNDIIAICREYKLPIVANAWFFSDVFCDNPSQFPAAWPVGDERRTWFAQGNPGNVKLDMQEGDWFMLENYGVDNASVLKYDNGLNRVIECRDTRELTKSPMKIMALSVVKEASGNTTTYRNVDYTKTVPFVDLPTLTKYLQSMAMVHNMDAWGIGGFTFGSNGYPVQNLKMVAPPQFGKRLNLVVNATATTHTRNYEGGTLQVKVAVSAALTTANTAATVTLDTVLA